MAIPISTVSVNQASRGCVSQTRQSIEKEYFYQGRAWKSRKTGKKQQQNNKNIKEVQY